MAGTVYKQPTNQARVVFCSQYIAIAVRWVCLVYMVSQTLREIEHKNTLGTQVTINE